MIVLISRRNLFHVERDYAIDTTKIDCYQQFDYRQRDDDDGDFVVNNSKSKEKPGEVIESIVVQLNE